MIPRNKSTQMNGDSRNRRRRLRPSAIIWQKARKNLPYAPATGSQTQRSSRSFRQCPTVVCVDIISGSRAHSRTVLYVLFRHDVASSESPRSDQPGGKKTACGDPQLKTRMTDQQGSRPEPWSAGGVFGCKVPLNGGTISLLLWHRGSPDKQLSDIPRWPRDLKK